VYFVKVWSQQQRLFNKWDLMVLHNVVVEMVCMKRTLAIAPLKIRLAHDGCRSVITLTLSSKRVVDILATEPALTFSQISSAFCHKSNA
jgi:hypothetical protein